MKKPKSVKTTFDQYTVIDIIGQGGSGFVYSAFNNDGESFAIKILDSTKTSKEKLKRFENEYRFCSKNKHPNIITVLDHGITDDGLPFFVMPLYEGSLRELFKTIKDNQKLKAFSKILDGIEAAHKLKIIHRDIKPENILFRNNGNEIVIADFGIATFEEEDLYTAVETKDGTRLANFQYAAPEQRNRGVKVDHKVDLYALGLILNELFTGEIPFGTNFKKINDVSSNYPYLDKLVERMLEQNPQSRFENIEQIKQELKARGEEYVSFQKINQLEQTVIPTGEIDDPIVREPMRIVGFDWEDGVLKLEFNHAVNSIWQWALLNMGGYTSISGKGPEIFQFKGNQAIISSTATQVKDIINYFKQWLPNANLTYKNKLISLQQEEERKKLEELKNKIAKEKERLDVLKNIKL